MSTLLLYNKIIDLSTSYVFFFIKKIESILIAIPITQYITNASVCLPEFVIMPTTIHPVVNVAHPAFHKLNVIREMHPYVFVKISTREGTQPSKSGNKNIYFM